MGKKINQNEIEKLSNTITGYDYCQICHGLEEVGKQKLIFEDDTQTVCDECLAEVEGFKGWIANDNVTRIGDHLYTTQDALHKNRLNVKELVEYYRKEFVN